MNFNEWVIGDININNFKYLEEPFYFSPFKRTQIIYEVGNGNWTFYVGENKPMWWDENIIFNI